MGNWNGAILADERPRKTNSGLYCIIWNTQEFKDALLIVPVSLLNDWKNKLKSWVSEIHKLIYHYSKEELPKKLRRLQIGAHGVQRHAFYLGPIQKNMREFYSLFPLIQSQDVHTVGRAHRISQTRDVKTYRLITCGTQVNRILCSTSHKKS